MAVARPRAGARAVAVNALIAVVLMLAACPAAAQVVSDTETARRAHAISSDIMSPYCPGRTLADCPSPDAAALRGEVRTLVAQGVSEPEIRARLEAHFGDVVRGVPRSLWGWLLPVVALLLGAVALVVALRRMLRPPPDAAEASPVDPELEAELDRELAERGL